MVGSEEKDVAASGWGKGRTPTFAQARQELLDESSRMTGEERLMAMWKLNRRWRRTVALTSINLKHIGLYRELLGAGVEFAVVGGVAVNVHGVTRATYNLNIFIRPCISNAEAAFRALQAVGAPLTGLEPHDLRNDEHHFRFGTRGEHVDILASIGEMTFDEVWHERIDVDVAGLAVPLLSKGV